MDKHCKCGLLLKTETRKIMFVSGHSPIYSNLIKIKATWCSNPNCKNERVEVVKN